MNRIFTVIFSLMTPFLLISQDLYQFSIKNHLNEARFNGILYDVNLDTHSSIGAISNDTLSKIKSAFKQGLSTEKSSWFGKKLLDENLISAEEKDRYSIKIDPLFNLQLGQDVENDDNLVVNSRGFLVQSRLGKGLSFYSSFIETQALLPSYINAFVNQNLVVPGQGFARTFGESSWDYNFSEGAVNYKTNDFFDFTLGQGRNFFGEGYRSMLLSDAPYSYPFFRIQTKFWKIKYVNLWAQLRDVRDEVSPGSVFAKKYLSSHYLSINITKRWNLSLFESIVLGDTNQQRGVDPAFFNPVIFYRPVEFSVGSGVGNALLGMASSYKIDNGVQVYTQFVLDEFTFSEFFDNTGYWGNKYGFQLGLKYYDLFGLEGFFARFEFNHATPYTYGHKQALSNYGHYGQSLAHPWGANFNEALVHLLYTRGRWEFEARIHYGQMGLDTNGSNWGGDIYISYITRESDYGNETTQGVTGNLSFMLLRTAWIVNPSTNLKIEAGLQYRNLSTQETTTPIAGGSSNYVFLGLRTDLYNHYYDF